MSYSSPKKKKTVVRLRPGRLLVSMLVLVLFFCGAFFLLNACSEKAGREDLAAVPTPTPPKEIVRYLASDGGEIDGYDEAGVKTASFIRGTRVTYLEDTEAVEGRMPVTVEGGTYYIALSDMAEDEKDVVRETTFFMRTAQNLITDPETGELGALVPKGTELTVTGFDYLMEDGSVHEYKVTFGEGEDHIESAEGYVRPWYLEETAEAAVSTGDEQYTAIHNAREDRYGGGDGASLDYTAREKGDFEDNMMPEECRTLYLGCYHGVIEMVDDYIALADSCGINAFVVDIMDGTAIGYPSKVMEEVSPTAFANAGNTMEEYAAAIQKIKDAGYYVIGRMTTFNDTNFIDDHPECGILSTDGKPITIDGCRWPTVFSRAAWKYKVDLAKEAVDTFGFNEIQFDYIRFPNGTYSYEKAGTIDFQNTYNETRAQAVQRFLMYACDELHEKGVYVSADVFGETSNDYVCAYGQYWPAISNVADVISAMPYPDHYGESGGWKPWEHPYEIMSIFANGAAERQKEIPTPAVARTWIQAYDAIRPPYTTYGPDNVLAQIRALRDAGLTGGYMTWNGGSNISKYTSQKSAFDA